MKKIVITSVACLVLWANVASAQPQVSGPFLPSGCTADQTIAYNATTAAWECDSTISVTSLTASGTAPVVTWTDTTAGEDDFSFTVDADVGTLASGATNIFQAFGATHAQAGNVYFVGNVGIGTTAPRYKSTTIGVLSSLLSDDGTNYGGLTITPNAADVTFAAVTAGTFGDNVDLMFTPAGTGDMWLTLGDLNIDTDAGVLNFGAAQDNAIGRADASSIYVSKGLHVGGTGAVADNTLKVDGSVEIVTTLQVPDIVGNDALALRSLSNADISITPNGSGRLKYGVALNTAVDGGLTPAFTANMAGSTGGPTAAAQNGWLLLKDSAGAAIWVPVWK